MKPAVIKGRIWTLVDASGKLIEDIDTDQIFHNAHLHITELAQMGPLALGNLEGWKDFPTRAKPGDIVVAGRNFGAGSSRQQAVDCFISLGIAAIAAPSFSAIYFRNAVNSGFPIVRAAGLERAVEAGLLRSGDEMEIDLRAGTGRLFASDGRAVGDAGGDLSVEPMALVPFEIYRAGGLFAYGRHMKKPEVR
jgi:3-isopropylmalate/(R)-2-methylmalate dehydratase small subunit